MPELKPLQRFASVLRGNHLPIASVEKAKYGKYALCSHVQAREKLLVDALRKTQGWMTDEDRTAISDLLAQFDAEEHQ
jgi:hypothetical protein